VTPIFTIEVSFLKLYDLAHGGRAIKKDISFGAPLAFDLFLEGALK
jgi:hypothetical protein